MPEQNCTKCGAKLDPEEAREYAGQELCEDCYLDAQSITKTCDPWAVHTAKSLKDLPGGVLLTPLQQQFYDLVKERGEVSIADACTHLGLKEEDLRREFATLRHLEKLRGCKKEDRIFITLF